MSRVFADTSFYIAFLNPRDAWHPAAIAMGDRCRGGMMTTEYVLVELGNHLCSPTDRGLFLRMAAKLQEDETTTIVPATSELLKDGLTLFGKRPDKGWSLTDCISFSVMGAHNITEALTCDRHFEQAGFHLLMRE